jgi:hypothetical protein
VLAVLTSFRKLASARHLENTNNLQAYKWQIYVIAILATPKYAK